MYVVLFVVVLHDSVAPATVSPVVVVLVQVTVRVYLGRAPRPVVVDAWGAIQ